MLGEAAGSWRRIRGEVIRGHRVASGSNRNPHYPGGTLAMQAPVFADLGLSLDGYHLATLNVSLAPSRFEVVEAPRTFRGVRWHPRDPPEDFSFLDCRLREPTTGEWVGGLVYFPHPDTKPAHLQPDDVMEFLAARVLGGIEYGCRIEIEIPESQMRILP